MTTTTRTFRPISLLITLTAFALAVLYEILFVLLTDGPLPPPEWLTRLYPILWFVAFAALIAGYRAITPFRTHAPRQLVGVILVAIISIATPFLAVISSPRARELDGGPSHRFGRNLNGIAKSCVLYAFDNSGHFPPDPTILVLDGSLSPKQFSTYDIPPLTLPNPLPPASAWPTLAGTLDQHSAFIYTAADLVDTAMASGNPTLSLDPTIIIAYTKKTRLISNGRMVAFADNHVDFIRDAELPAVFAASNATRAKLGLSPITLDGPPPVPPK